MIHITSTGQNTESAAPLLLPLQRGRPRSSAAQTQAQRSKAYRDRLKDDGLTAIKCHLAPEPMAYLAALCEIHTLTIAEAIGMALTAAIRGTPPTP